MYLEDSIDEASEEFDEVLKEIARYDYIWKVALILTTVSPVGIGLGIGFNMPNLGSFFVFLGIASLVTLIAESIEGNRNEKRMFSLSSKILNEINQGLDLLAAPPVSKKIH